MPEQTFSRAQVDRSTRKFVDAVRDLQSCQEETWHNCLEDLLRFCETDPVMSVVTGPLRDYPKEKVERWHSGIKEKAKNGNASYKLPANDDERTAFLYQFLKCVESREINLLNFAYLTFEFDDERRILSIINMEFVVKFARNVTYKLEELQEQLGNAERVSQNQMHVFNIDNSTRIEHAHASTIAVGGSSINDAISKIETKEDLTLVLAELLPLFESLSADSKASASHSHELLMKAVESGTQTNAELIAIVKSMTVASPSIASKLSEIGWKLAGQAATSGVGLAIKLALAANQIPI